MTPRIGVLLLHGMGDPGPDHADALVGRLRGRLGARAGDVAFEPCHWAPVLQRQQDVTWERLATSPMRQRRLRRWVVSALGDPATYLSGYLRGGEPAYAAVHARVRDALRRLEARLARPDAPLVVLAHSLGAVVASNYAWDAQREAGVVRPRTERTPDGAAASPAHGAPGATPFERMESLAGLVTYGCNIPLFLPPAPPVECIAFPPPTLAPALRAAARWVNVYDPDDVLGYPIAGVWDELHGTRIEDVVMEVGGPLAGWTPLAHARYDGSARFAALVADRIAALLHVMDTGAGAGG